MKKILTGLVLLFFITSPAFCKTNAKFDVKSGSFMDLGRYTETLEINDNYIKEEDYPVQEDTFEEEAMLDVLKRFEANAIELDLSDNSEEALNNVNSNRIFKLKVNETQYNIEQGIKNENMIWDTSKSFAHTIFSDSRHLAPIPSVVNSSRIKSNLSQSLSASMGQTSLYDANGPSVLFIRSNESTYNTGSVISYKGNSMNLSVGSFSSSYNHAASGGAVLSSNSINLPFNTGSIVLGGGYFANEAQDYDKSTGGGFIEYSYKRFKINAQAGKSKYSNSLDCDTSLYLIPEFKISDSLSLKTRLIRNVTQDTMKDELVVTYKPKKSKNNFEFEINASNQYNQNTTINQRIKLTTSFKI